MKTDGQLYSPPASKPAECERVPEHNKECVLPQKKGRGLFADTDTVLIIAVILVIVSDKCKTDLPLLLALLYLLLEK